MSEWLESGKQTVLTWLALVWEALQPFLSWVRGWPPQLQILVFLSAVVILFVLYQAWAVNQPTEWDEYYQRNN